MYLHVTVRRESARVMITQRHRVHHKVVAEVDIQQIGAHFAWIISAVVGVAITELALPQECTRAESN